MSQPLTLGLLFSSTKDSYEQALYRGVREVAEKAGADVICFTSGALRAYRGFEMQRNVLFDLVNDQNVDGLIISGTLAHPISKAETQAFFKRFEDIPRVSIALSMPGVPYVMVDSRQAIQEVVKHLVEVHGYQKLAFIKGPSGHEEAEERYRSFCETLAEYDLTVDPGLVVPGDYTFLSGKTAMQELLQRPGATFQAVVSANDSMALGAMEVFRAAGKKIPEEAAFTGFDDTLEGRFAASPLTSVRQSVYEQGQLATQLLLQQIAGHSIAKKNTSPARLVVRKSCGCTGFSPPESPTPIQHHANWLDTLQAQRHQIEEAVFEKMSHLPKDVVFSWVNTWLEALTAALPACQVQKFLEVLEVSQRNGALLGIELAVWSRALAAFFHEVQICLVEVPLQQCAAQVEALTQIQLGATAEHLEHARQIELSRRDVTLGETSEGLMTTFDLEGVLDVLCMDFPRLNVQACFLSLFEDPQNPAERSRLIFGWQHGERLALPPEGVGFPSKQLVPPEMRAALSNSDWVVEALYSKEDRLGFMLLKVDPHHISVCYDLRALISGALQGVLLLDQRRQVEEELRQSQRQLETLVAKLEMNNRELETFAYSVSHDLRSPLRAISGFAEILFNEYAQMLDASGQHFLTRIHANVQRMNTLIDDLLAFSRLNQREIKKTPIDMPALVWQIIEELEPQCLQRHIDWQVQSLPPCSADPSLMKQVLLNLLENAVKYTRPRPVAVIQIGAQTLDDETIYAVCDNGVGFDMQYVDKLFAVFQRLHSVEQFEGTGIGLATVQRIIHRHGGRIWAEANVDQGATFFFTVG